MKRPTTVEVLIETALVKKEISQERVQQLHQLMNRRTLSEADWRAYDRLSDAVLEGQIEISTPVNP